MSGKKIFSAVGLQGRLFSLFWCYIIVRGSTNGIYHLKVASTSSISRYEAKWYDQIGKRKIIFFFVLFSNLEEYQKEKMNTV
jgi:hypothetical protein